MQVNYTYRIVSNCGPGDQDQFLSESHNYVKFQIHILEKIGWIPCIRKL